MHILNIPIENRGGLQAVTGVVCYDVKLTDSNLDMLYPIFKIY